MRDATQRVYVTLADFGRLVEFHFTPGPVPGEFRAFGRSSCGGTYVIVPTGTGAAAACDWLQDRDADMDVSPHARAAIYGWAVPAQNR